MKEKKEKLIELVRKAAPSDPPQGVHITGDHAIAGHGSTIVRARTIRVETLVLPCFGACQRAREHTRPGPSAPHPWPPLELATIERLRPLLDGFKKNSRSLKAPFFVASNPCTPRSFAPPVDNCSNLLSCRYFSPFPGISRNSLSPSPCRI
jgi:hypothetical protein